MTAATNKTGRVTKLADVKGVISYRFVPKDWVCPLPNLTWFAFDPIKHADEYEKWQTDILARADRLREFNGETWDFTVTWSRNFFEPVYTARVDFDPVDRPVLVAIGGL